MSSSSFFNSGKTKLLTQIQLPEPYPVIKTKRKIPKILNVLNLEDAAQVTKAKKGKPITKIHIRFCINSWLNPKVSLTRLATWTTTKENTA